MAIATARSHGQRTLCLSRGFYGKAAPLAITTDITMRDPLGRMLVLLLVATAVSLLGSGLWAQLGERPGNSQDNPIDVPKDLSGLSIKNPRVRVVHTNDPSLAGGSLYLQQADPWLGYKIGWSLTQREF